jgi:MFS family permease
VIVGGTYAVSAPLWGRLCDKTSQPKIITLIGSFLCIAGFLVIGPPPFMPFEPTLWLTCIGLGIFGLGIGACLVSGFIQTLRDALARGFPNNVSTFGLTSGFWTSSFALGSFIGPTIGGVLLDNWGFQLGTIYVLATQAIVASLVIIFLLIWWRQSTNESKRPLLRVSQDILPQSLLSEKEAEALKSKQYGSMT